MKVGTILDLIRMGREIFLSPWKNHPISNEVERLAALGAGHIEFTTDFLFSNLKAARAFESEKARLGSIARERELTYSFHLPTSGGFCTGSAWKQVRSGSVAWLREFVQSMAPMEPTGYVMHPQALSDLFHIDLGPMQTGLLSARQVLFYFTRNVIIPNEREALAEIRTFVAPEKIFLENSENIDFYMLKDFALGSGYSVCMDVGHLLVDGQDLSKFANTFRPVLRHVHLHDVIDKAPANAPGQHRDHRPLGTGIADVPEIVRLLHSVEFDGAIVIEDYFQDPADSIRYLVERLRGRP